LSPIKPPAAVRLLVLLLFYGCVTLWLTWPLAENPSRTLPCTDAACHFDTRYSAWVLAWQSHALTTASAHVADANIYAPVRDALYYGPAGFGALPYFAPTYLATGSAALATNVLLLVSAALSALSLHWVVRRWTGLDSAGFVAAATLLLHQWYLWGFVASTPHLAPLQYFPLIVLVAASGRRDAAWAALLTALIVAQCLTDPVYVAVAVLAPLGTLAIVRIVRRPSRRSGLVLAAVLAASLACLVPFVLGYLRVRAQNPLLAQQTVWRVPALPSDLAALLWHHRMPTTIAPAALVLLLLGGVLAVARRGRPPLRHDAGWRHGALWLLVGVAVSVSPGAVFAGHRVYLPQDLLAATTPLYEIVRLPNRLGVAALIGACILVGIAFAEVMCALGRTRVGRTGVRVLHGALAVAVAVALYVIMPPATPPLPAAYPLQKLPLPPPSFLAELAHGSGPLVHLPALKETDRESPSPQQNAQAMYLSTFHWRPLLNGYSSYWPEGFLERLALAETLPGRAALAKLISATGVRAIWVDLGAYAPKDRARWSDAQLGLVRGLELRGRAGRQLLFAVDPAAFGARAPLP
jgi:hypothetical protein